MNQMENYKVLCSNQMRLVKGLEKLSDLDFIPPLSWPSFIYGPFNVFVNF